MMCAISWSDFADRVYALYSTGRHAPSTLGRVDQVLRELYSLGVETTADLTTATMAAYVTSKGPAANANTVNGLLSSIASLCSYAVEEGWLDRPPAWRRIRLRPSPMVLNLPPHHDAVCRLLSYLHGRHESSWEAHRLCALAWLVALTGVRLGEALHAQLGDLAGGQLHVTASRHRLKTEASERLVPLPVTLRRTLEEWVPHAGPWLFPGVRRRGPWTGGTAHSRPLGALRLAAEGAGLRRLTWHSLRHSFGTSCFERWSVPAWVTQQVLGHSDIRTTMRYAHLKGSPAIAEAMRGVDYGAPA